METSSASSTQIVTKSFSRLQSTMGIMTQRPSASLQCAVTWQSAAEAFLVKFPGRSTRYSKPAARLSHRGGRRTAAIPANCFRTYRQLRLSRLGPRLCPLRSQRLVRLSRLGPRRCPLRSPHPPQPSPQLQPPPVEVILVISAMVTATTLLTTTSASGMVETAVKRAVWIPVLCAGNILHSIAWTQHSAIIRRCRPAPHPHQPRQPYRPLGRVPRQQVR